MQQEKADNSPIMNSAISISITDSISNLKNLNFLESKILESIKELQNLINRDCF